MTTQTSRCPGCARRLPTLPPEHTHELARWACRCGVTGFQRRSDGYQVWTLGPVEYAPTASSIGGRG